MSKHEARVRLQHMLDAAREAIGFSEGKHRSDLDNDRMLSLSLVKLIEIIGEAARYVPSESRQVYSDIPWADVVGMRHHLVHGYDLIDLDIVWQVVTHDLPPLVAALEKLLLAGK
ncbi:MAG: DUF86 domain-containing protein [Chloroflexota bacterium]